MVQMFPNNDVIFQDGSSPVHTTRIVASWFVDHEDALQHLSRPAQLPDILKPLWSVLESEVRSRFPPPSSLKQLEDVLNEVSCNIPLETVHNLYQSVPRRVQAVLRANVGPAPYYKKCVPSHLSPLFCPSPVSYTHNTSHQPLHSVCVY
jgi:hypothetical protein